MCFDRSGSFSIAPGNCIAEAMLIIGSHGDERTFAALQDWLNEQGFAIFSSVNQSATSSGDNAGPGRKLPTSDSSRPIPPTSPRHQHPALGIRCNS
jgi:hypothetical protein